LGFLFIFVRASGSLQLNQCDWVCGGKLIKQSCWLILSGMAAVIYLKIGQIMLEQMVGRESVGIYSVAVRLSEVWYFFAAAVVISVFPALLTARC